MEISHYVRDDVISRTYHSDRLLILKKPNEVLKIHKLVAALIRRGQLISGLHALVKNSTAELKTLCSLIQATLEWHSHEQILMYNENFLQLYAQHQ